ncbi:MAG: hypothetical protein ACOY16_02160 [Chloroflexota bacterium]
MKFPIRPWLVLLVFVSGLSACSTSPSTQGPTTWVDQPINRAHLPLAALTIQAHASDAEGISSFEFYLSENLLASVPASGQRLSEASLQWQPPAPGEYDLQVRALDQMGNPGEMARLHITISESPLAAATSSPALPQCALTSLSAPLLIAPADGANIEGNALFSWAYPDPSCHPHSFAIDISPDASFSDLTLGFATHDYNETSRSWPLPAGQCYFWRVRAYVPDSFGPPSPAWSFCLTAALTPISATLTPSAESPTFTLLQNANCRAGPSTMYPVVDTFPKDSAVAIAGRNADNSWLWVERLSAGGYCWVAVSVGNPSGNWMNLPLIATPSLPPSATWVPPTATTTPGYIISTITAPDFTPPLITNVSINPPNINQKGCGFPDTLTISATVTDPSGVGNVTYELRGPGPMDGGDGYLLPAGGDVYQAVIGPLAGSTGMWSITLRSVDMANNAAQAGPWTFQLWCIQ